MNYFLVLILIVLGCGGYYEYTAMQKAQLTAQYQMSQLQSQLTSLDAENKKLRDATVKLVDELVAAKKQAGDLAAANKQIADLTAQLKAQSPPTTQASGAPPPNPAAQAAAAYAKLGTWTTVDGKTYQNCQLLKVEADGITFSHADGITKVLFPFLPPNLQARFSYSIQEAGQLTPEQVEADEQQLQSPLAAGK